MFWRNGPDNFTGWIATIDEHWRVAMWSEPQQPAIHLATAIVLTRRKHHTLPWHRSGYSPSGQYIFQNCRSYEKRDAKTAWNYRLPPSPHPFSICRVDRNKWAKKRGWNVAPRSRGYARKLWLCERIHRTTANFVPVNRSHIVQHLFSADADFAKILREIPMLKGTQARDSI